MIGLIKNHFKEHKYIYLSVTSILLIFVMFFKFVFKKPFLLGNDQWLQYNIFYKEWINLILDFIKGKGLPMYSWNMYLGTDFYSAMGYYCTGDIFLPLLLLFRNNIELGLIIETMLCVYIAAILMDILLKKYGVFDYKIRTFISLIYAFGGQASQFVGHYMFFRFYAFMPLLFIGFLKYLENKNKSTFIIATAILFLQSYYLMFPTLIFLFIFAVMMEIKNNKTFKEILNDFISLLICLLVGFFISSVITLPSIVYLLNNPRIGSNETYSVFWYPRVYVGLYSSLTTFIPWQINPIFKTPNQGHDNLYSLFITIIPLISCISYACKKENRCEGILLLILIITMCLKPLSSIMHGFSEPSLRWIFLVEFYMLILAAKGMNIRTNKWIFIVYFLSTLLAICLFCIFTVTNYDVAKGHLFIIAVGLVLDIIIYLMYRKGIKYVLTLSIVEIVIFLCFDFYTKTVIENCYVTNDAIKREDVYYFKSLDEDEYRYYINFLNNQPPITLNKNKSLDYGFMSTSAYNSMYDYNTNQFSKLSKSRLIPDSDYMGWVLECDDPYANTMLGVKYYIVYKEDELPKELEFEYAYNLDYLMVYKSLNYKGFGYTAKQLKYTKDFNDTKDFYDYILVDDETINISKYKNISEVKLNIDERYKNCFRANIDIDNDNILLIPIPNNKGWNIKVNGEKVTPLSTNGGFIGLELSSGHNDIEMNFCSPCFNIGLLMSAGGAIMLGLIVIRGKRNEENY